MRGRSEESGLLVERTLLVLRSRAIEDVPELGCVGDGSRSLVFEGFVSRTLSGASPDGHAAVPALHGFRRP